MIGADTRLHHAGRSAGVTGRAPDPRRPDDTETDENRPSILVVEDESLIARDLAELLKSLDYDVPAIATDGREALPAVREHRPDLVLMDIRLGSDMTGVEAARRIRSEVDVPVVYTTAYADEDTLAEAVRSGPYGYVVKPYTGDSLRSAVEVALARHRSERNVRERAWWFREMVAHSREAVVVLDPRGRVERANSAMERILGCTAEEVEGSAVLDRVHPEDERRAQDAFGRCVDSPGERVEVDLRIVHPDGGWRPIDAVGRGVRGPGERTRVLVSAREAGSGAAGGRTGPAGGQDDI